MLEILITFVAMAVFGLGVMYDVYKHKKDRTAVPQLLLTLIGIASLAVAVSNLFDFASSHGMI